MSDRPAVRTTLRRRDRRAAERRIAATAPRRAGRRLALLKQSPLLTLTLAVVAAAIAAIATIQMLQPSARGGPAEPGTRTAAGVLVPLDGTPAALAAGRSIGSPAAPLTLTVWSDFQCPACRAFSSTVEPQLISDYVVSGKLRIEYRDLLIIGPESRAAAIASRCADAQGAFWPYHDVLFANQAPENSGALTSTRLADMADAVGLDRKAFAACTADTTVAAGVDAEVVQGRTRGQSTPTLDLGSRVVAGSPPYAQLRATLDELLAAANAK